MTLNSSGNNHFYQRVFDVTSMIPTGRITTYGAIADFLGLGSARMVGWALNQCHQLEIQIPAHRVINRKGELVGRNHFATPKLMAELLIAEGIEVRDNVVLEFGKFFWHPREIEQL